MRRTVLMASAAMVAASAVVYASLRPEEPRLVAFVSQSPATSPSDQAPVPRSLDAPRAEILCLEALPEQYLLVNAELTTVGEIRQERGGPMTASGEPGKLWPDAFPELSESEPAAWCHASIGDSYVAYATARQEFLKLATLDGLTTPPPPGPPLIE